MPSHQNNSEYELEECNNAFEEDNFSNDEDRCLVS